MARIVGVWRQHDRERFAPAAGVVARETNLVSYARCRKQWVLRDMTWLGDLFKNRSAAKRRRKNDPLQRVVDESAQVFKNIPLRDYIEKDAQEALSRQLYLEINEVFNAIEPVNHCREKLGRYMMKFASYQVLLIPPQPEDDVTGLRSQPGISGELGQHIVKIFNVNHELRAAYDGPSDSITDESLLRHAQEKYWHWHWFLETFNAARKELGDQPDDGDWYLPFKHAACVTYEATYRREIDLPPAFDEPHARDASMAYALFTDIVIAGDNNPAHAWREYHQGSEIPVPQFGS